MNMTANPTRRSLICLASGVGAAALLVGGVAAANPTSEVEAAFADWKAVRQACDDDPEGWNADHPGWERMNRAEDTIDNSPETGARVAEIRLWVALTYGLVADKQHKAIRREDIDWLLSSLEEGDYPERSMLRAIRALRSEA